MATYKHLRSSTANKRPTTSIADGQLAINSNAASAGLFFKDSTGATIIKVGPVHVGTTAPNATPGAGGSSGNSTGEVWLDTSLTPVGVKIWNGSAWVNGTPIGSTTVQGLLELATDAETQAGSDTARAVTPASLQSKVSDSTSTTSSTTIASSTAVKSAFDLANAALPKSGGTVTGNLEIGTAGSLTFEGSVADGFETTIAVTNPTADRTITLPDTTGTVVTTGDTGTVTSTMLLDGTIVNADVNASAAIAGTKIAPDFGSQTVQTTGIFSHALGSATAPTVTFTGDTNTGIYSPGADQLAISTGGTGRLFVDASGNVGVGATAVAKFTSYDAATAYSAMFRSGTSSSLLVFGNSGTSNNYHQGIGAVGTDLVAVAGNSERLRITSAGLVGVGTSSPQNLFHLRSDVSGAVTQLYLMNRTSGASVESRIAFTTSANDLTDNRHAYIGAVTTGAGENGNSFVIATNPNGQAAQTRVFVSSTGNVGVGTTSPGRRLEVVSSEDTAILSRSTGTSSYIQFTETGSSRYIGNNNNNIVFLTGAGAEQARIDSSGRLLVGTSSARSNFFNSTYTPRLQLESVSNGANSSIALISNGNSAFNESNLIFAKSRGNTIGDNTVVVSGDDIGGIQFQASDGTEFVTAAAILAEVDGTPGANDMPGRLVFSTTAAGASSPTERMRITSAGKTTIFAASGQNVLGVHTASAAGTTDYAFYVGSSATSTTGFSAINLGIFTNGNVVNTNNSYGAISDIKLKENIVDAGSQWSDLKALQVRKYNFKEGQTHTQIGLVAQEVELVSPGLVSESPDRDEDGNDLGTVTKSVNYSVLYMKAVKALQEAMERIETLEARLTAAGI